MSNKGVKLFTRSDILRIRLEWDAQVINVKDWAQAFACSRETIRKVGRRETYFDVPEGRAGHNEPVKLATIRPDQPTLPEPTEDEVVASLSRFRQLADQRSGKTAAQMLEELRSGTAKPANPLDE